MRAFSTLLTVALATVLVPIAQAAETGDIRGLIEDASEVAIPGVEVVISGPGIAGERRTETSATGVFNLPALPPGQYELIAYWQGTPMAQAAVTVSYNRTTRVPIVIDLSAVDTVIQIVDIAPAIDMASSALSMTIDETTMQNMPVGRNFSDVVKTLPGVSGRVDTQSGGAGGSNPSVRGEGQYGNNYAIDGISVRDPATNTVGNDVNFDAIQEIQVYTDGAPAEFGQFTGMMVNVVSKDGGDEHHGSVAAFYSQHAWFDREYNILDVDSGTEVPTTKRRFRSPSLAMTAGGPIIKEKLWYFTAWTLNYNWAIPEGFDESAAQSVSGGQGMGKLTWFATPDITVRYNFTASPSWRSNSNNNPLTQPEAQQDRRDLAMTHMVRMNYTPNENTAIEVFGGLTRNTINVVPVSGDLVAAPYTDSSGALRGNAINYDYNTRQRIGGGVRLTQFLEGLGQHKFKVGADFWALSFNREIVNTGETTINWIDGDGVDTGVPTLVGTRYSADPDNGYDCTAADGSDCGFREHWVNVGPLGNNIRTYSFFAQDDWTIANQLSINVGARVDIEDGFNDSGERPAAQSIEEYLLPPEERTLSTLSPRVMPAPRLGVSWDVLGKGPTKVFGNYGRYYDIAGGDFWEWSNARNSAGFVRMRRDPTTGEFVHSNTQDPSASPLIYAADLQPAHMDKIILGVEQALWDNVVVSLRGILSQTTNIPEDVDVNLDDWYIANTPLKERNYRGIELAIQRQHTDNWGFYGSWTMSESWGHTPGQFELASNATSGSNGNNVGVYLDDIGEQGDREFFYNNDYGWLLEGLKGLGRYSVSDPTYNDDAGFFGYLPYQSFHAVKLNGSYTLPFGSTLGLIYEFDSGHAWQKRTLVPFYGYDSFNEGRGTRFMPATHYIDLRIAHMLTFGEHQSLEASLDVFNVPGAQTPITYFENDTTGFGSTLFRQSPRGIRAGVKYRW
jgi:hypothetical protein